MYPFWTTNTDNGYYVWWPFYRSLGGRLPLDSYFSQDDGVIQYGLERMLMVCVPYFTCGIMNVLVGAMRGLALR